MTGREELGKVASACTAFTPINHEAASEFADDRAALDHHRADLAVQVWESCPDAPLEEMRFYVRRPEEGAVEAGNWHPDVAYFVEASYGWTDENKNGPCVFVRRRTDLGEPVEHVPTG